MLMSKMYLSDLRDFTNPLCTEFYLDDFRKALTEEGLEVADVGTSEEELRSLCEEGYLRAAFHKFEDVYRQVNPLCDRFYIEEGEDPSKDQSYVLFQVLI